MSKHGSLIRIKPALRNLLRMIGMFCMHLPRNLVDLGRPKLFL